MSAANRFSGRLQRFSLTALSEILDPLSGNLSGGTGLGKGCSFQGGVRKWEKKNPNWDVLHIAGWDSAFRPFLMPPPPRVMEGRNQYCPIVRLYQCSYLDMVAALKEFYFRKGGGVLFIGMFLTEVTISQQKSFPRVFTGVNFRSMNKSSAQAFSAGTF